MSRFDRIFHDFLIVLCAVTVVVLLWFAFKVNPQPLSENMSKQTQCTIYSKWCFWPTCGECE
jgi:hypothetical protein